MNIVEAFVGEGARLIPGRENDSGTHKLDDYKTYSSQAAYFADLVKHLHRLPALDDPVWGKLDVEYIAMDRPFGGWRIEQVWFDDESCYIAAGQNVGTVDESFMLPEIED